MEKVITSRQMRYHIKAHEIPKLMVKSSSIVFSLLKLASHSEHFECFISSRSEQLAREPLVTRAMGEEAGLQITVNSGGKRQA